MKKSLDQVKVAVPWVSPVFLNRKETVEKNAMS